MTTLILADDHPLFLAGLRAVLDAEDDLEVLATAGTGEQALRAAMEHRPDVAVLDISMPEGDGLSVGARMRRAGLATRVLVLTMSGNDESVLAALRAGARGYTLKNAAPEEIVAAVRAVARGEAVFGAGVAERMLGLFVRRASAAPFPQLTEREHEVLRLMANGSDNTALVLNALYGVTSILSGLGLVIAGVAIRRTGRWTGWRSWLVLALGVYILLPLTAAVAVPVPAGDLALTVLMLLFAALGAVLASTGEPS